MRLDEIMQPHSDNLASNMTLTLPRLKSIMTNSGLNGDDIQYIDDIEILRPNGGVLRVTVAYYQEQPTSSDEGVLAHAHVLLYKDQDNKWLAKVERRDPQKVERRDPSSTQSVQYKGQERRLNNVERRG